MKMSADLGHILLIKRHKWALEMWCGPFQYEEEGCHLYKPKVSPDWIPFWGGGIPKNLMKPSQKAGCSCAHSPLNLQHSGYIFQHRHVSFFAHWYLKLWPPWGSDGSTAVKCMLVVLSASTERTSQPRLTLKDGDWGVSSCEMFPYIASIVPPPLKHLHWHDVRLQTSPRASRAASDAASSFLFFFTLFNGG